MDQQVEGMNDSPQESPATWTEADLAALLHCKNTDPSTWPIPSLSQSWVDPDAPAWEDFGLSEKELREAVATEAILRRSATRLHWVNTLQAALYETLPEGKHKILAGRLGDAITDAVLVVVAAAIDVLPGIWRQMPEDMLEGIVTRALDTLPPQRPPEPGGAE